MSPKLSSLLNQLRDCISEHDTYLITAIEQEINRIQNQQHDQKPAVNHQPQLNNETGCYQIGDRNTQYCPNCYERDQQLIKVQRLNSKLRVCSLCRSSLKSNMNSQATEKLEKNIEID